MRLARKLVVTGAIMWFLVSFSPAGETPADPQISKIVSEVSEARIRGILERLVKFGVRAIGINGAESLVSPYVYAPRARTEIEPVK